LTLRSWPLLNTYHSTEQWLARGYRRQRTEQKFPALVDGNSRSPKIFGLRKELIFYGFFDDMANRFLNGKLFHKGTMSKFLVGFHRKMDEQSFTQALSLVKTESTPFVVFYLSHGGNIPEINPLTNRTDSSYTK
jgi:hypothetical protein